jgi:RNA ligase
MQLMTSAPLPQLREILDTTLLQRMLDERYVRKVTDQETGYSLYNYTARAQFENLWNPVTLGCRGLIVDGQGVLIARPFGKFHNYSKEVVDELLGGDAGGVASGTDAGGLTSTAQVVATDKMDGSLGILYRVGDEARVATRGSFSSAQARHATEVLHTKYSEFEPQDGWTYLFEIVYPQNRIVVDYGDQDDLVLLGAVQIASGRSVPLEEARTGWSGPVVEVLAHNLLADALAAAPRDNAEGMVLHFVEADTRVKLKQVEYVRLHRLVTDVSERRVWEELSVGRDISEWLEMVPDEFYRFVTQTRDALLASHREVKEGLALELSRIMTELMEEHGDGWSRRELAEKVTASDHPLKRGLFAMVDGKNVDALVWEAIKPAAHTAFFQAEDEQA